MIQNDFIKRQLEKNIFFKINNSVVVHEDERERIQRTGEQRHLKMKKLQQP